MTASELIQLLAESIAQHGDRPVYIGVGEQDHYSSQYVVTARSVHPLQGTKTRHVGEGKARQLGYDAASGVNGITIG